MTPTLCARWCRLRSEMLLFALLTVKSFALQIVKFDASHQVNVKQSLTAADVFHICEAIFHFEDISLVPKKRISLKKAFATANAFFMVRVAIQNFLKNIVISMVSGFRTTKFLACNFIFSPQIQGDCWKTVAFFYTQVNPIKDVEIRVEKPLFYPLWFAFQSKHECFPMW